MKKKIGLMLVIILIALLGYWWLLSKPEEIEYTPRRNNVNYEIDNVKDSEKETVRLSIFNTSDAKASLEIPVDWEGNYRLKENNTQATFLYIGDPLSPVEFLRINNHPKNTSYPADEQEIMEGDNFIYTYTLSTEGLEGGTGSYLIQNMIKDIPGIIDSIKIINS